VERLLYTCFTMAVFQVMSSAFYVFSHWVPTALWVGIQFYTSIVYTRQSKLASKHEALSSDPIPSKKKKKSEGQRGVKLGVELEFKSTLLRVNAWTGGVAQWYSMCFVCSRF
jgi:hypothetical protein